jgi:peptide deformylase
MAVKEIVLYPEGADVLREKSKPVGSVTERVGRLVQDLEDTLNDHREGIGLAAPQIGAHSRVVVVRLGGGRDDASEPGPPRP